MKTIWQILSGSCTPATDLLSAIANHDISYEEAVSAYQRRTAYPAKTLQEAAHQEHLHQLYVDC